MWILFASWMKNKNCPLALLSKQLCIATQKVNELGKSPSAGWQFFYYYYYRYVLLFITIIMYFFIIINIAIDIYYYIFLKILVCVISFFFMGFYYFLYVFIIFFNNWTMHLLFPFWSPSVEQHIAQQWVVCCSTCEVRLVMDLNNGHIPSILWAGCWNNKPPHHGLCVVL